MNSDQYILINQDSLNYLKKEVLPSFDLIFLDPPFNQDLIATTLSLLSKASLIHLKSKIYIESEYELSLDLLISNMSHKCKIDEQKKSGNVYYCLISLEE